jgi:N-sulfoglucosamine sulfohydrolase
MRFVCALVAVLAPSLSAQNGPKPNTAKPNIVLFVADDLGREIGCYGDPAIRTPNLDRLAASGVRFDEAFATTASCSASRSVILSGRHNHANGQYGHAHSFHHFVSLPGHPTLSTRLAAAGYRTARSGKFHLAPNEVYPFEQRLEGGARSPVAMADACRPLFEARDGRPFFLYFCTSDPHRGGGPVEGDPLGPDAFGNRVQGYPGIEPVTYDPATLSVPPYLPDTPTCRAELAQYAQSVARVDQGLGRLLALLEETGHRDDTLVIFTSDHGIAFAGAKTTLYEGGMRVPLVVRAPGRGKAGTTCDALVTHADLAPTILEWAGVPVQPGAMHGRSWLTAMNEQHPPGWDVAYASHTFHEVTMYYPMRVVRERRYKLIWNLAYPLPFPFATDLWASPTWREALSRGPDAAYGPWTVAGFQQRPEFELYDLEQDPWEGHNLAQDPRHAKLLDRLKSDLRAFQARTNDPWIAKWDHE